MTSSLIFSRLETILSDLRRKLKGLISPSTTAQPFRMTPSTSTSMSTMRFTHSPKMTRSSTLEFNNMYHLSYFDRKLINFPPYIKRLTKYNNLFTSTDIRSTGLNNLPKSLSLKAKSTVLVLGPINLFRSLCKTGE